jgi:hypothetical protein
VDNVVPISKKQKYATDEEVAEMIAALKTLEETLNR